MFKCVCGVPALSTWCGPTLPHVGGVQHSPEATATGPTPHQDLQAVGSNVAKHSGLGPGDGLIAWTTWLMVEAKAVFSMAKFTIPWLKVFGRVVFDLVLLNGLKAWIGFVTWR